MTSEPGFQECGEVLELNVKIYLNILKMSAIRLVSMIPKSFQYFIRNIRKGKISRNTLFFQISKQWVQMLFQMQVRELGVDD